MMRGDQKQIFSALHIILFSVYSSISNRGIVLLDTAEQYTVHKVWSVDNSMLTRHDATI